MSLLFAAGLVLSGRAADSVTVNASSAVRVAWVESALTAGAGAADGSALQSTFAPVFRRTLEGVYGAQTAVEFLPMSASRAATRLLYGEVDAVLQFSPRLSRRIQQAGSHVLRAESVTEPGTFVAFLVLPEAQAELRGLLANAFSVTINHFDVRRTLHDVAPDTELAGW